MKDKIRKKQKGKEKKNILRSGRLKQPKSDKKEQEFEGMLANDERELKRQAEWAAACEFLQSLRDHRLQQP